MKRIHAHGTSERAKQHLPESRTPQHQGGEKWQEKLPPTRTITSFPAGKHQLGPTSAEDRLWHRASYPISPKQLMRKRPPHSCNRVGGLGEQQDPCYVLPPYSEQPFPGQCAAFRHPCAWERDPGAPTVLLADGAWSLLSSHPMHQDTLGSSFAMD